ncbi:DHA2 family efflux MFS transporter permease subunit [Candidatus Poribacteria bacterium]|nr:DHA2 family efflux MFS transporter permease subunit [Candidatus Poribacteria bacterium]
MDDRVYVNKWLIAATVMIPTIMEIVDTSVANVALDHIRGSLSAGVDEVTWVLTSYLVSNAIIIPITGWLARTFGRKRYLMFSIMLFTISSFMCGSAPNLGTLVFFRVLQGIGGGALQPMSQAILFESFPPRQHGVAMAVFGVGVMFGPIVGPFLGGWLTDNLNWRWIFYVNIPIGVVALIMAYSFIYDPSYLRRKGKGAQPQGERGKAIGEIQEEEKERIDYWGLALLVTWVGCLQIVLDNGHRKDWFNSHFIVILSAISVAAFAFFIVVELTTPSPVVNLRTFKNRSFTGGNIMMFVAFFCFFGSIVLLPLYLQLLMGYTATLAGMALSPGGIASLISMAIMGRLIGKFDPRFILAFGISLTCYSFYMMTQFNLASNYQFVLMPRVIQGLGIGCLFVPLTTLTVSHIPKQEMGNATGIFNLLRNLGGSFGVAFSATMLARHTQINQNHLVEHLAPTGISFQQAFQSLKLALPRMGVIPALQDDAALGVIYRELQRQALMLSFNDSFRYLFMIFFLTVPFLFLLKRPQFGEAVAVH